MVGLETVQGLPLPRDNLSSAASDGQPASNLLENNAEYPMWLLGDKLTTLALFSHPIPMVLGINIFVAIGK